MISVNTAIEIHRLVAEATGGGVGLRDAGLLEGALASAYQSFGGVELYPTPLHKAVHIGYSLITSHPFVDGNKRIGVVVMLSLLRLWGVGHSICNKDVTFIGLGVASGELNEEQLLSFVASRADAFCD